MATLVLGVHDLPALSEDHKPWYTEKDPPLRKCYNCYKCFGVPLLLSMTASCGLTPYNLTAMLCKTAVMCKAACHHLFPVRRQLYTAGL